MNAHKTVAGWSEKSVRVLIAVLVGLIFGALARMAMQAIDPAEEGFSWYWLMVHMMSGTWFWALFATCVTWWLMRQLSMCGWRRYFWAFGLAEVLLVVLSASWYVVSDLYGIFWLAALCSVPAAGIGFVAAFAGERRWVGLLARLCLPAGLFLTLLASLPPQLSEGGRSLVIFVWWVQIAISFVLVIYALTRQLQTAAKENKDE